MLISCNTLYSKEPTKLTLSDVVEVYALNSPSARIERLKFINEILEYKNYNKSMLPSLAFTLNPVSYNRSLRLLQSPETGSYSYVSDYSNTSSVGLSISQKVGLTGGTINIGSDLSLLNEFSNKRKTFSTSPFYISYNQKLFGGRKQFSMEKEIMKVRSELAVKNYCEKLSNIQSRAVELFLIALQEKLASDLYLENISINDTLLRVGNVRYKGGHITEYEYRQIELQSADTKYAYRKALMNYGDAVNELGSYLSIDPDTMMLATLEHDLPRHIDEQLAQQLICANNPTYLEHKHQILQAEQELYSAKLATRFNGSINLNYGMNHHADDFIAAYKNHNVRQSVAIGFQIPVWQWGINRNKRRIARNNYEASKLAAENSLRQFTDNINECINTYNHSALLWGLSEESLKLTRLEYTLAVKSFSLGEISVYELLASRQRQNEILKEYFGAMKDTYTSYFQLRNMALYDFKQRKNLEDIYINDNIHEIA